MKNTIRGLLLAACMLAGTLWANNPVKVHTLGDSTMANYDENATVTRGWGMYVQQFLEGATSINYAKGGRDSRGGYEELWAAAKNNVAAGDYVLIQFAHNDEKNSGMDGLALRDYYLSKGDNAAAAAVDLRGSVPTTTYRANLRKIAEEALAMGAHPVFVGPVCRSYFDGNGKIKRNGRHDLGDNYQVLTDQGPKAGTKLAADDHTMDYAHQMRLLAEEMGLPYIDLTTATRDLYEGYGAANCEKQLFDGAGSTHFNAVGATLAARLCAQMLKQQDILTDYIRLTSELSVTPSEAHLGEAYKGQTLSREFSLSGFDMQPASGKITIAATAGIQLSTNKAEWASQLSIDYTGGTLVQNFYAQVELAEAGALTGTITISQGDKTLSIPVSATAVVLEGGADAKAFWRLEKDASCTVEGPVTAIDEVWKGMVLEKYSAPKGGTDANGNYYTSYPDGIPAGEQPDRKTQRNVIEGSSWPADEIDDNPERYIDFGVKAAPGTQIKVTRIALYVGGAGGSGMMCHVYYSTDGFQTRSTLYAPTKMASNTMNRVEAQPVLTLHEGEELHVRVYPWYDGAATGKTICLSDVLIEGKALDETAIDTSLVSNEVVSTRIYTPDGRRHSRLQPGLNLVRRQMSDGSVLTEKIIQ